MQATLPIGELKTHCYQILEEARKNNQSLFITRRGSVIAKIFPVNENDRDSILGLMKGQAQLKLERIKYPGLEWETKRA
jgi:antitoxin (DNA-binding transcriptional repressor) of toxin-antitoxin stability system